MNDLAADLMVDLPVTRDRAVDLLVDPVNDLAAFLRLAFLLVIMIAIAVDDALVVAIDNALVALSRTVAIDMMIEVVTLDLGVDRDRDRDRDHGRDRGRDRGRALFVERRLGGDRRRETLT